MKLREILTEMVPDPADLFNPVELDSNLKGEEPPIPALKGKEPVRDSLRKDSNVAKAKRIRTRAKMKARDASPKETDDTDTSYALGGHVSTWLNR